MDLRCLAALTHGRKEPVGKGGAFFVSPLLLATAYHVVEPKPERGTDREITIYVGFVDSAMAPGAVPGSFTLGFSCRVIARDEEHDIALLRPAANPFLIPELAPYLSVARLTEELVSPDQSIVATAFRARDDNPRLSSLEQIHGRISCITNLMRRGVTTPVIVMDRLLWEGASGSAVFSESGEVIGLVGSHVEGDRTAVRSAYYIRQLLSKVANSEARFVSIIKADH